MRGGILPGSRIHGKKAGTFQTMGLFFVNPVSGAGMGTGQSWDLGTCETGSVIKGVGWERYRDGLMRLGFAPTAWVETTNGSLPAFMIRGEACFAYAAMFDYVAMGHWPTQNAVDRVRFWASQMGRDVKVGTYFVNFESINQRTALSGPEQAMRVITRGALMDGTGLNGYGCLDVDPYEVSGSGGTSCSPTDVGSGSTTHVWYADVLEAVRSASGQASDLADVLDAQYKAHYSGRGLDFILTDNCLDQCNFGTATNEPVVSGAQYQAFYKEWPRALALRDVVTQGRIKELWYNRGEVGVATYTAADIPNRYGEFYMHNAGDPTSLVSKTLATFQTEFSAAGTNGVRIAIGHSQKNNEIDLWSTSDGPGGTKGKWKDLHAYCQTNKLLNNVIVVAARHSSGFYAHWQPEFGEIV